MKKILLILVPLLAFLGGAVGGDMLGGSKPAEPAQGDAATAAEPGAAETGNPAPDHGGEDSGGEATDTGASLDWFAFPNQFFVPILRNGTPSAIMILSLSVEMPASARAEIEAQEHRLRDALLNALMIEANTGGFDGNFTAEPAMQRLRAALLAAGRKAAGPNVRRILIEDIGQQIQ
ncbi:hypothetical protein SAMN04244548_04234 [Paracoccus pantotrophus]|nr:hypothetical protein SAMN04244548_04234 [Paracoccus pantotrophus]